MEIASFGIGSVAAITVICLLIGQLVKALPIDDKWIPIIVGFCGGILGVVASFVMPDFPAGDIITSIAVGIVSGLSATGVNQIFKQLSREQMDGSFDKEDLEEMNTKDLVMMASTLGVYVPGMSKDDVVDALMDVKLSVEVR